MIKMQHPEFELYTTGIHAKSGVACADCHMPYIREGALKVSDHWIRSPLTNVANACQTCHQLDEDDAHRAHHHDPGRAPPSCCARPRRRSSPRSTPSWRRKAAGATDEELAEARDFHRKAKMRWDFISSENSTGFHSPQEAARVLGDAMNFARMAQLSAERLLTRLRTSPAPIRSSSSTSPRWPTPSRGGQARQRRVRASSSATPSRTSGAASRPRSASIVAYSSRRRPPPRTTAPSTPCRVR